MNTAQAPAWLPTQLIPFFTLSYPTAPPAHPDSFPDSNYYATGLLDGCFIITVIAIFAVLRDATRLLVMEPFARWKLARDLRLAKRKLAQANGKANGNGHANGHANGYAAGLERVTPAERRKMQHSVIRFAEQGWSVVYYTVQMFFGMYVHYNLPTSALNPIDVWTDYPHNPLAGPVKLYYLLQTAFYTHQILVINAEARRKDHWQMLGHHFITVPLMVGSYFYNYTRVGCLIMFLMDWSDIFLPLAKMIRYLGYSMACDLCFVVFMVSWLITRHFFFVLVIKSTWEARNIIPRIWDPSRGHFMTKEIYFGFFAMLCALQLLQLMWFWMVCRVAYRVVTGKGAEDSRSDDEGDGDEDDAKKDD